ncbi:hypothetical protein KXD93_13800 [Mucilaginibacter sp. BJC16-A38]|uniref:hypothetical protein n=1 Tax=Mucilaginibacter phenanthrenivorans TaxID=1234842 RepID=UPI0021577285|nr:hypothetical protein [Mucilaginibacter phenanthrenivorans]MCR8558726.1 hypothetical protein [Mucilaginibacter phenanthrenivorans]
MNLSLFFTGLCLLVSIQFASAQSVQWIRPDNEKSPPMWGIKGGIVFSLWPKSIEPSGPGTDGGPRGLIRIGYEYQGSVNLINYIAIEPVVNGDMEFSEVSPSRGDGKWGKFLWATDKPDADSFTPYANTRGTITHPDPQNPTIEQLSFFICMEKFNDGAHPYLKVTISSDKPGELGLQIFNQPGSAIMERCALTATMGNYSRLRLLYLKDKVIDSRKLFAGYDDIDFIEKEPYPASQMLKNKHGDLMVCAESNETFNELAAWPQQPDYLKKWGWRYRPFYKLTQYWRVDSAGYDSSLQVRVNGRVKYWGAENPDKSAYTAVPGGPAFENFELRDNYHPGQKFYFGLTRKSAGELIDEF